MWWLGLTKGGTVLRIHKLSTSFTRNPNTETSFVQKSSPVRGAPVHASVHHQAHVVHLHHWPTLEFAFQREQQPYQEVTSQIEQMLPLSIGATWLLVTAGGTLNRTYDFVVSLQQFGCSTHSRGFARAPVNGSTLTSLQHYAITAQLGSRL